MASTVKQERASKKYYETHKKYREKKIDKQIKKQKANKTETAEYQKSYYHSNEEYKKYKQKYAKAYRKREPIKSKATKDRINYKKK